MTDEQKELLNQLMDLHERYGEGEFDLETATKQFPHWVSKSLMDVKTKDKDDDESSSL